MSESRWKVLDTDKPAIYRGLVAMIRCDDRLIAVVTEDGRSCDPDEWPRVARMIAAAPDLYEALHHAETIMMMVEPRSNKGEYLEALRKASAALAKAVPRPGE